jgi:hypothetical protein
MLVNFESHSGEVALSNTKTARRGRV